METNEIISTLAEYCKNNIEDFELLEALALNNIDRMRCPLSMACPQLDSAMCECIEEWAEDNDMDIDEIWENVSVDDIFWAMD